MALTFDKVKMKFWKTVFSHKCLARKGVNASEDVSHNAIFLFDFSFF